MTTSTAEMDIALSYQLLANCHLGKPVQLEEFESLVDGINNFWLTTVLSQEEVAQELIP